MQARAGKWESELKDALQRLEQSELERRELLLRNTKFECRLKQAQIILNDPGDRVDLQLNTLGAGSEDMLLCPDGLGM